MECKKNLGKTILDGLKLAFEVSDCNRTELKDIKGIRLWGNVALMRLAPCYQYQHNFRLCIDKDEVANLYFTDDVSIDETDNTSYIYVRISNHVLYSATYLQSVLKLLTKSGLSFSHFTYMELAKDFTFNVTNRLNSLMRTDGILTVINGKAVKDKKEIINNFIEIRSRSLLRSCNAELALRSQKGDLRLKAYNKMREIQDMENMSGIGQGYKDYILEFYGNPRSLHRLEVSVNSVKLRSVLGNTQSLDMLFNQDILDELFKYFVSRLMRFSLSSISASGHIRARNTIDIDWILDGMGGDFNKLSHYAKKNKPNEFKYIKLNDVKFCDLFDSNTKAYLDNY
jgi:hypothetical protein